MSSPYNYSQWSPDSYVESRYAFDGEERIIVNGVLTAMLNQGMLLMVRRELVLTDALKEAQRLKFSPLKEI